MKYGVGDVQIVCRAHSEQKEIITGLISYYMFIDHIYYVVPNVMSELTWALKSPRTMGISYCGTAEIKQSSSS